MIVTTGLTTEEERLVSKMNWPSRRSSSTCGAALAIVASAVTLVPADAVAQGYDCAHGPDTYRVRNVAQWDVLNMRSSPNPGSRIVGQIAPQGSGVHCLGPCQGRWCRVSWRGMVGWVNMRFLGE